MESGLRSFDIFVIIIFTIVFNLMWYFAIKYLREKDKNIKRDNH